MRLINDVFGQLLANFNQKNSMTLTRDQVEFRDIRPVTSIYPRPQTTKNTAITMALKRNAPAQGEVTLYYDRIPLRRPYHQAPLQMPALQLVVTTEHDIVTLLPKINRRLGTRLTPSDVLNRELSLRKGFDLITLQASPSSPNFIGTLEMLAVRGTATGNDIVIDTYKPVWYYDNYLTETTPGYPMNTKYQPAWLTYMKDYSAQADFLRTVPADLVTRLTPEMSTALAAALKAVDTRAWTSTNSRISGNLYNAWVIYNGPCSDIGSDVGIVTEEVALMADGGWDGVRADEFDNVLLIRTNAPWTDSYGGRSAIVIHYNNEVA